MAYEPRETPLTSQIPQLKEVLDQIVRHLADTPAQLRVQSQTSRNGCLVAQQTSGSIASSPSLGLVCTTRPNLATIVFKVHGAFVVVVVVVLVVAGYQASN